MDTNQYIDVFLDESREHLQAVNDNLLKLEKHPRELGLVNEIFRSAHTLKGMAATMGFEDIASLTHQMENVLDKIRNEELHVTTEVIDITFHAIENLEKMVMAISEGNDGKKDVTEIVHQLVKLEKGNDIPLQTEDPVETVNHRHMELDEYQTTVISVAEEQGYHPYSITVELNDDCILKAVRAYMVVEALEAAGEIIKANPAVEELEDGNFEQDFSLILLSKKSSLDIQSIIQKVSEIQHVNVENLNSPKIIKAENMVETTTKVPSVKTNGKNGSSKTIRVNLERINNLMNLFEEMVIDRSRLENIAEKVANPELSETIEHMARVTSEMQSLILTMRMVSIEHVFSRFPRMVRGLAKDLNKKIALEIIGAETELDRTVIDEIGDPLVHLIRNAVDHGIETSQMRKQSGKPEEGTLILRAYHSGNHVFIEIEDDGAGISREKVEAKAIENGLLTAEEAEKRTDEEIFQLILSSGFSTANKISDISGRGVGLDVVKNKIEALGGQIKIDSIIGLGSTFSVQLPLTLSILSTLLVKVQREIYAVPLSSIIETVLLDKEQVLSAHGQKVIDYRGNVIPLVSIKDVFQVGEDKRINGEQVAIVIVKKGDKLTGLIVDSFIGQQEVVLKTLGNYLKDVYAISGATILGDGRVSLILDPNALVK